MLHTSLHSIRFRLQ